MRPRTCWPDACCTARSWPLALLQRTATRRPCGCCVTCSGFLRARSADRSGVETDRDEDAGARAAVETGRGIRRGPHDRLQELPEAVRGLRALELQVQRDVAGVVLGLEDPLRHDAGLAPYVVEAVEGGQPHRQVVDLVLDAQDRQRDLPPMIIPATRPSPRPE